MDTQTNKALCHAFIDKVWNSGDLSLVPYFVAPDAVNHELDAVGDPQAAAGHTQEWLADLVFLYRYAFPDLRLEVQGQIAEADRVVTLLRMRGTHKNKLMAIAATNRPVDVAALRIDRMADGMIAESWFHLDSLSLLRQLGALPHVERQPRPVPAPERIAAAPHSGFAHQPAAMVAVS
jgi:predicted ester cyclase